MNFFLKFKPIKYCLWFMRMEQVSCKDLTSCLVRKFGKGFGGINLADHFFKHLILQNLPREDPRLMPALKVLYNPW